FQAEDGIRDRNVTGVQTCALPIFNNLVFFGFYCLLIGYLIFSSTFLPRILGALMAFGGLGWLTFLSPALAHSLSPYNMAPGMIRSEEHTSELQSRFDLVCRLLLEK